MKINVDDLSHPEVIALLEEHLRQMIAVTPAGSVHALDVDALKKPDITFWSVWDGPVLVGCGALKKLDRYHAEIKSMRTATAHQGKGIATRAVKSITDYGIRDLGLQRIFAEPYVTNPASARVLEKAGFTREGILRANVFKDGQVLDQFLYSYIADLSVRPLADAAGEAPDPA